MGCGKTDAFALTSKTGTYVFFDIYTLFKQNRQYSIDKVFVTHEVLHGWHFAHNPTFSIKNYRTPEDQLLKSMISEGLATYIAAKITGADERSSFWGNILKYERRHSGRRHGNTAATAYAGYK